MPADAFRPPYLFVAWHIESGYHLYHSDRSICDIELWILTCCILLVTYFSSFYKIQLLAFQLHSDLSGTVKGVFNSGGYLQIAVFITHEFSMDLLVKCTTGILPATWCVIKYFHFMWKMDQVCFSKISNEITVLGYVLLEEYCSVEKNQIQLIWSNWI